MLFKTNKIWFYYKTYWYTCCTLIDFGWLYIIHYDPRNSWNYYIYLNLEESLCKLLSGMGKFGILALKIFPLFNNLALFCILGLFFMFGLFLTSVFVFISVINLALCLRCLLASGTPKLNIYKYPKYLIHTFYF